MSYRRQIRYKQMRDARIYGGNYGANVDKNGKSWFQNKRAEDPNYGNDMNRKQLDDAYWDDKRGESQQRDLPNVNNLPMPGVSVNSMPNGYSIGDNGILLKSKSVDVAQTGTLKGVSIGRDPLQNVQVHIAPIEQKAFNFANPDQVKAGQAGWADVQVADRKALLSDPNFYKNNKILEYDAATQQEMFKDPSFDWKQLPWAQKKYFELSSSPTAMGAAQGLVMGAGNPGGAITGGAIGTAAAWAGYDQNKEFWQQGDGKFTFNVQQIKDISNGAMGFMNYAAEVAEKTIGTAAMAANAMTDPNRDVADVLNKDTWNSNISFFEAITPAYIAAGGSQALGKDGRLGAVDALKLIPTLFASGAMYELVANPEKYKGKEYYLGAALPVELEQSWVERLDDARARVAAGENEREVMSEMQNGLMAQMGDMIGQGIFDPLNLVGGLGTFVGKVSSNATGNKVAGAAFTGTKNLTEAKAKYKNLVQTEGYKVIDPNFDPKKMSSLSKMIAGVTTDIHGNITNKAGSLFGMSKAGLLDPIRPDEYVSGPVKSLKDLGGFVKMLATETPQARAETGGSLFADNVTAFLGSFENSRAGVREGIKYLKALASNDMETWSQMGSQFANSPEFYTVLPALQKFNADKLSGLLVLLEGSEVNSDYLQTISDITGDAKGRLIDDIALRGTAEQDFARVIEKAKTSTDPKAKSFLAEVEAKKFTAQTLAEIVDVFTGEGALPRTPEHWKALIGAELSDHYGEWAAKNFQLDKSPEAKSAFFQTMGILKSAQSFLLLGGSPSYPIQNGLSGLLHLAASGIYGFTDETFLKDFGDLPSRMEEGVGSGGVVESKGGAIQKAMKGERGVFTSVKDRMGKISSGMPMSKFSSWIEKKMGRRAIATQMKRMWSQSWRRGVGFSKMKPELINIMKELKVDPERFYGAIEAGLNQAQIEKALYGKFEGVQSRALIHEAATVTGKSVTQSRTMLETLGVFDQLDSYLRGRTTRDGVNAAFDKALKVADDQVDIRMGENLIAKADLIKQKVGLEGGLAALDVAQQASMKYTNAWHDHYILFGDLNERLKDIPDPKMQAKEYKRAYQQSDKDFVKVNVDNAVIFTGVFNAWGQSKNTDALNFLKYMGDGSAAMKGAYDFMRQLRDEHFSTEWNGDIDAMFANWDRIQPLIDKAMKEGFAKKRIADVKMGESIGKMYKDLYGPEAGEAARRWSEDVVKFNDHIREEQNKFNQSLSGKDKAQRAAMKAEYYPQSKQVQIAELARINQEGIGGLERVIKAGQGGAGSSPMTPNTPVPPTTPTTSAPSAGAQAIDATLAERAQADAQMKADEAAAVRPEDEINSAFNDGQGKPNAPAKPTPAQEFADMTAKAEQRVVNEQAEKAAQAESIWSVAAEYTDKNGKAYTPDNKWALIGALKKEEYGGDSTLLGFDDITPEFIRDVLEKQKTVHEARAAEAAQVVQADVITKPRSELDPRLSEALNMEAKRIADVVSGGEAGKRQFADGKFIGATSSTYPDWYNDLQKQTGGKQKLLAALEKIQKDHGADKGVVVERVKEFLTWSLMNGDTATGSPPRLDVLKLLGADDATLNNALLDLNEQFGTAFTLEQALDNNFESYDPMAGIASNEPAFDAQAWEDGVMKAAQGDDLLAVYEAIDLPAEMYDRAMFEGGETYRQFIEKITKDAENANEIRNRDEAVATHMTEAEQAITQQASKSNAVMTRKLLEEKFTESFGDEPQVQAFMSVFDAVVGTFARITGENVDSFTARFYEDVMRSNETDFEDGLNQAYGRIEIAERTLTQVDFENLARMLVRQGEGELRRAIQSEPNKANRRAILEEVYKLNSKLGDKVARSEIALFQRAYHGSPYKFDKFSLDHMGKGEGNQAYGWGLYFAGDKAVAEWYRETLSYRKTGDAVYKGERIDERQKRTAVMDIERNAKTKADAESSIAAKLEVIDDRIASGKRIQQNPTVETRGDKYYAHPVVGFGKHFDTLKEGKDWARLEWAKEIADLYKERQQIASISLDDFDFQEVNKGQLYNVEIPDDGYLLWDKPLSEQPQAIKDAIRKGGYEIYKKDNYEAVRYDGAYYDTGESIYNLLKQGYGTKRGASTALKEAGLNGIKYLDGDSRGAGEGNFNYVIFDDAAIDVVETYYQAQEASTKGAVTFDGLQATIHAFEAADVTTLVHENAHVFMQMLKDVAAKTKNETVVRDLATIMEHVRADEVSAGVWKNANADHSITAKDGKFVYQGPTATDTRVFDSFEQAEGVLQQEVFARSWENYQATGKAPTPALVKAFESFRTWMLDIYKSITGSEIDVKISEDVRQVFDRMLGAEDVKPRLGEGEYNYEGNVDQFGGRGMFNANSDRNVREFFIRKGMPRQYVEGTSYRVLSGLIEQMIPLTSQRGTFDWNDLGSAQADWIRKLEMPSSKNKDALYHKNLKKVQGGQADMFAQPAPQAELFAQVEPSAVAKVEPVWKYEEYSAFSRKLAQTHPKAELEKKLRQLEGEQSRNTNAHLAAIDKTSSMTGNSQHRAQSGNVVRGNYEQRRFLEDALEIYKQYPDKTKESVAPAPQVIEFIQGKLASAEKMNKKYPGSMGKDWLDKLQGAADTYKTYVEKHGEDYPIVLMRDETQGAIITQSNHVIGEWQVTYFDKQGFSGHHNEKTKAEAYWDTYNQGMTRPDPDLFESMSATDLFNAGVVWSQMPDDKRFQTSIEQVRQEMFGQAPQPAAAPQVDMFGQATQDTGTMGGMLPGMQSATGMMFDVQAGITKMDAGRARSLFDVDATRSTADKAGTALSAGDIVTDENGKRYNVKGANLRGKVLTMDGKILEPASVERVARQEGMFETMNKRYDAQAIASADTNPDMLFQSATPKPEPINLGGEQPFGSVDNALGDLSIPHDEIMAEGMKTEVRPLLEAMREIALKQVSDPAARMDGMRDMSPEGQKMLRQYMKQVQNEMASAKLSTMRWGETKRDEALLNYSKRYGIDRYLEIAYPYQFFYTRSMMSWAARAIDKPAWFANYARIKRQQDRYERDIPERLRGKIKIDMPWMPDWMGDSMYINPMGLFTPANFLKPFERMQSDSTMQQQEAERILQEWSADESVSATAAQTAAQTRTGTTWERALAEAKIRRESEIGNPLDFFNTMLGPAWYLTTPLNAMGIKTSISDGDPNKITSTPLMNTSRALDTVTQGTWAEGFGNVAGIYAKVEQGIQKKLGVPEFGEYGDYYIDRQLANMTAEGAISAEDAQMAMMERSGKNFEDARERVKLELAMRVPTMAALMAGLTADNFAQGVGRAASTMPASLFGAALLPAGELEYRGLKQEWNEALKKSDAGDKTAIPEFFDENPEYQAYLSKGKPPEERIKSFLIGQIWDGYMELGETNQKQARAQMGDLFSQSFLDKETRSYDTLTVEQLTDWAKMFGKKTPLPLSTEAAPQVDTLGGNEPAALNLYDPQVTQYTDAYFSQRREKFPNYYQTEQGYYNIPKSERTAYLMAHPDLKQYWNWKDSWSQAHPELVPIFKGQVFKQVDTSNWSPALVDYVQMYAMTGERLGKGATAALNQQWIMAGSPYGDMQSWLDSQVAPAMLYSGGGQ
jgi:hypothetical protein